MAIIEHDCGPLIPPWAETIAVKREEDRLLVQGRRRAFAPWTIPPNGRAGMAAVNLYTPYLEARRGRRKARAPLIHVEFANAVDDERLVAFVERFGPIESSESGGHEGDRSVEAVQDLAALRREQQMFAGAVRVAGELRRRTEDPHGIAQGLSTIALAIHRGGFVGDLKKWADRSGSLNGLFVKIQSDHPSWATKARSAPDYAQGLAKLDASRLRAFGLDVLCTLLNHFPLSLFPIGDKLIELPKSSETGMLPVIYFLLRREFLYGRGLAVCARPGCGKVFRIMRSGAEFCSARCSQLERQREYWHRQGKTRRRKRSKKAKDKKG